MLPRAGAPGPQRGSAVDVVATVIACKGTGRLQGNRSLEWAASRGGRPRGARALVTGEKPMKFVWASNRREVRDDEERRVLQGVLVVDELAVRCLTSGVRVLSILTRSHAHGEPRCAAPLRGDRREHPRDTDPERRSQDQHVGHDLGVRAQAVGVSERCGGASHGRRGRSTAYN